MSSIAPGSHPGTDMCAAVHVNSLGRTWELPLIGGNSNPGPSAPLRLRVGAQQAQSTYQWRRRLGRTTDRGNISHRM